MVAFAFLVCALRFLFWGACMLEQRKRMLAGLVDVWRVVRGIEYTR